MGEGGNRRRRGKTATDTSFRFPRAGYAVTATSQASLVWNRRLCWRGDIRIDGHAAQLIVSCGERLIVLLRGRNIRLRAGLLPAFGREMTAHRRLSLEFNAALQFVGHILQHLDIGLG